MWYVCVYVIYMNVSMCVCGAQYIHECIYMFIYTCVFMRYIYEHTSFYVCVMYTYVHVCITIFVYVYVWTVKLNLE